jgi:hypothetical protein
MATRRLIALGLATFATGIWGCGGKPNNVPRWAQPGDNQSADNPQAVQPVQGEPKKVDQMDARAGSLDVLAQKTNSYIKEMTPLVEARRSNAAPVPTDVRWMEPSDGWPDGSALRLDPGRVEPSATHEPPARHTVRPVIDTSPVRANQPASPDVPPSRSSAIVREVAMANVPQAPQTPPAVRPIAASTSDALSDRLNSQLKNSPRDVWAHMEYQMFRLLRDEPAPDLSSLSSLPNEDRELVSVLLDGLSNFRNALRADSNMMLSGKIRPILDMSERLRSQAELTIPTMALCTKVNGFGSYEPIDPPRFATDREQSLVVYCEVANFMSNLNDKRLWETRLKVDMTLYTSEDAIPVWSHKSESINDATRARRHDFFVVRLITLPKTLPIGRYLLKVTIIDTQSNRIAEATSPLVMTAQ